jgi:hypothetical protein
MDITSIKEKLLEALPLTSIMNDLTQLMIERSHAIELGGVEVLIPHDIQHQIVARSYHDYFMPLGFGDHCRVLVALGGVKSAKAGIITSQYGFATLWYKPSGELITVDFSETM